MEIRGGPSSGAEHAYVATRWMRRARLPVRPRPIPSELASSYLVRVTQANGYESPRACWRAIYREGCAELSSLKWALRLSRAELDDIEGPLPSYTGITAPMPFGLRAEDFNHMRMRWCPVCLAESQHLRTEWGVKLCCVCIRHALILLDRCPACGERQRLERPNLTRCSCGFELERSRSLPAPPQWVDLHEVLICGLRGERGKWPFDLDAGAWIRLVKYLGQFDAAPATAHPGQVAGLHEIEKAIALTTGAASLLADWPRGFHAFLVRQRAAFPSATHIGDAFGTLYRVLYRELATPDFDFLRLAFEEYLRENWFGLLGRRNRRLSPPTVARHPRKPLHAIAQEAGAGKAIVRHLARAGAIRADAVRHQSGRTTWSVPDEEALRVTTYVADRITVREASVLLAISRPRVRELIDAGMLDVRIQRTDARAATWLLSRSSVERLGRMWTISDASDNGTARPQILFSKLLRTWMLRTGEFPAMVSAIAAGVLRPLGRTQPKGGLGSVVLPEDEVHEWLRARRISVDTWVSIDAAAKLLGIKQQVAYELAARGMLAATVASDDAEGHRRVHRDAIDAFRRTYMSLAEIAKARGTSPRHILKLVTATPVCGPSVDGARQYFYHRADVEPNPAVGVGGTSARA